MNDEDGRSPPADAAFATVPLAAVMGELGAGQLYLVAVVFGLFEMTSLAGFPALIPQLVPPGRLLVANALESVSFGVAELAGGWALPHRGGRVRTRHGRVRQPGERGIVCSVPSFAEC